MSLTAVAVIDKYVLLSSMASVYFSLRLFKSAVVSSTYTVGDGGDTAEPPVNVKKSPSPSDVS